MCSRPERGVRASLALIGCGVAVVMVSGQSRHSAALLGRLDPPAYAAPLMRAGESSAVFDEAIAAYGQRQFDRAAGLFRRFVAVEPEDRAANFFLAVSLMMTDEVGEAEDRLEAVLMEGESAFEKPARFVLAKALIRLGRRNAAERELGLVADSDGPYQRAAAELLARLKGADKRE